MQIDIGDLVKIKFPFYTSFVLSKDVYKVSTVENLEDGVHHQLIKEGGCSPTRPIPQSSLVLESDEGAYNAKRIT